MSGGYVLLEDGLRFDGELATDAESTGEIVFNTSMTGYQEAVTDPSYHGQIITFTYPLIGNYGVARASMESGEIHARAVVMREAKDSTDSHVAEEGWIEWLGGRGVAAISGVDTRALVRHIREKGAMRGGVFSCHTPAHEARRRISEEPRMSGRDLASHVTPDEPVEVGSGAGPLVAAIDTGIKRSILRNLTERGLRVVLMPAGSEPDAILARRPDALFLANGPGDPAALDYIVKCVRELVGRMPIFGICLGHQLLCQAVGLDTYKLRFGHRGSNHPVKDLSTGKIEITAQNHGFAVAGPGGRPGVDEDRPVRWETDFGQAELTHVNLYDRTVEGLRLLDVPAATVQYHPEAGPGPHDSLYLFDRFAGMM